MGRVTVRYRRGGKWYAHAMHMTECTDVPTPLQAEGDMPLHVASRRGDPDAVQALVDSKADLEAQDEVTMQEYKACLVPHPLRMLPSQLRQGDGV